MDSIERNILRVQAVGEFVFTILSVLCIFTLGQGSDMILCLELASFDVSAFCV